MYLYKGHKVELMRKFQMECVFTRAKKRLEKVIVDIDDPQRVGVYAYGVLLEARTTLYSQNIGVCHKQLGIETTRQDSYKQNGFNKTAVLVEAGKVTSARAFRSLDLGYYAGGWRIEVHIAGQLYHFIFAVSGLPEEGDEVVVADALHPFVRQTDMRRFLSAATILFPNHCEEILAKVS